MDTIKIQVVKDIPPFVTVYQNRLVKIPAMKKGTIAELPVNTAIAFIVKHRAKRVN